MSSARLVATLIASALVVTLVGCGATGSDSETVEPTALPVYPQVTTYPQIPVIENVTYATAGGAPLTLDICFPEDSQIDDKEVDPRAAIVSIHGGSWQRGDKANLTWRSICQWFASEGFVGVSVGYRLAPASTFPSQLQDVQAAVRWLRQPDQLRRLGIDPTRIGAFGGSAGGNLAALLGTTGTGEWTGARVSAVAELSGPVDLRGPIPATDSYNQDFPTVQLQYLGCAGFIGCAAAERASPVTLVDPTDPPFFVAHSTEEFIPIAQSDAFVSTLRDAGIDTTYVTVEGTLHSAAMLDDGMRERVLEFFRRTLPASPFDIAGAAPAPTD